MREIRTSGSMSGDGKRSVAAWPKLPRPSSTLPEQRSLELSFMTGFGGAADLQLVNRMSGIGGNDPFETMVFGSRITEGRD
jgi:hypothetical protein